MIHSNNELFQKINHVMKMLKIYGYSKVATQLDEALSISTVPSEILGEMKIVLMDIHSSVLPKQLGIENEIREVLEYLNRAL